MHAISPFSERMTTQCIHMPYCISTYKNVHSIHIAIGDSQGGGNYIGSCSMYDDTRFQDFSSQICGF